ncbi:hypothetical protein CsatB_006738 [Cannabis sativa]|uniref:Pectinesterase inhibitor domain-containing protein n=1 Tax=Cannabis sativa TaxID=3483 RepID=A0A7J6E102_CANSA|nr:hypothetical protein F8388_000785 [Cannabis sativa]
MNFPNLKISSQLSIFLFFLLVSTTTTTTKAISSPSYLVNRICKNTLNYNKCWAILGSDSQAKTTTDYRVLAKTALQLSILSTKDSLNFLIRKIESEQEVVKALKECAIWYDNAIKAFKNAMNEINMGKLADYHTFMNQAHYCQIALKNRYLPSVSQINSQLELYSDINFVITKILKQ